MAANPALTRDLLDVLIDRGDAEVLGDLTERADLTPDQVAALVRHGGPPVVVSLVRCGHLAVDPELFEDPVLAWLLVLGNWGTPEQVARFAADPDPRVRAELARWVGLPSRILHELADDPDIGVVAGVAGCASLPVEVAKRLAGHPDGEVRAELSSNPTQTVPPDVLVALLTGGIGPIRTCPACRVQDVAEPCDHVAVIELARGYAIRNILTPTSALVGFADSSDASDRAAVAARADLPADVLARLAADDAAAVRATVAENPGTPPAVLRTLAHDHDKDVRRAIARNPAVPLEILYDLVVHNRLNLRARIPRIQAATDAELRGLSRSRAAQVRALVASREDLPERLRRRLLEDRDASVVKQLADHPAVDADDLRLLAARHGTRLYSAIARNPNCPPELLHTMARNSHGVEHALREIARHPAVEPRTLMLCLGHQAARGYAAAHPSVPGRVLAGLLEDAQRDIVYNAAANPSLPVEAMTRLVLGQ